MSVSFSPSLSRRTLAWVDFKVALLDAGAPLRSDTTTDIYLVWFYDDPEIVLTSIYRNDVPQDIIDGGYSQIQNDSDKADFEAHYLALVNKKANDRRTTDGRARIATEKSDVENTIVYSFNWCDKTTWYCESISVVDEVATVLVPLTYTVYQVAHTNIIDTYHGKIPQETFLVDVNSVSYRVVVKVNGVPKVEQNPHLGTGGDYTVDYALGRVTLLSALTILDEVKVSYHYANTSGFVIKPATGKTLRVDNVKIQLSTDVVLTDSLYSQPQGLVEVFAPQLMPGVPAGTLVPLRNPVIYKTISDFQSIAMGISAPTTALGGGGWRGQSHQLIIVDLKNLTQQALIASKGMQLRLYLEHGVAFTGYCASATFFCLVENE